MMEPIRFCDPAAADASYVDELQRAVRDVLAGGNFILGEQVAAFEREVALYLGVEHAIGVGSGTAAIMLSLSAVGVGAGDEVILPSTTFFADAEAIAWTGATPVPVDSLEPACLDRVVTPNTRAVIAVSLYGAAIDTDPIVAWARRRRVIVIEDACQAFGARLRGDLAGTRGDLGCFSFYPSKVLGGAGDGGLVVTRSADLAGLVRSLRRHGCDVENKYRHVRLGHNSRLDEIQAAYLRVKLRHVDRAIDCRRERARIYSDRLAGTHLTLPPDRPDARDTFYAYAVHSPHRDALRRHLAAHAIQAPVHFPHPVHTQPAFVKRYGAARGAFDRAAAAARTQLSLPCHPGMTMLDVHRVCRAVLAFEETA